MAVDSLEEFPKADGQWWWDFVIKIKHNLFCKHYNGWLPVLAEIYDRLADICIKGPLLSHVMWKIATQDSDDSWNEGIGRIYPQILWQDKCQQHQSFPSKWDMNVE